MCIHMHALVLCAHARTHARIHSHTNTHCYIIPEINLSRVVLMVIHSKSSCAYVKWCCCAIVNGHTHIYLICELQTRATEPSSPSREKIRNVVAIMFLVCVRACVLTVCVRVCDSNQPYSMVACNVLGWDLFWPHPI